MKNYVLLICFMITAGMVSAQALKVAANSNVGIGVASPSEKLEVAGNALLQGFLKLENPTSIANTITGISGSKRLVVGTAPNTLSSVAFFEMFGDESVNGNISRAGEFGLSGSFIRFRVNNSSNSYGDVGMELRSNKDLYLYSQNALKQGTSGWSQISDKRLKSNISKYEGGLKDILEINPIWFSYNGEGGTSTKGRFVGVIAQEFQKVSPNSIGKYTYENNEKSYSKEYLSVDDSVIKYMLVNAIKEQHSEINDLKLEIEELRQLVNDLVALNINQDNNDSIDNNSDNVDFKIGKVKQNIPNPYRGNTKIEFVVPPSSNNARIEVYSMSGEMVMSQNIESKGKDSILINSENLGSGIYSYSLIVDNKLVETKRMSVLGK